MTNDKLIDKIAHAAWRASLIAFIPEVVDPIGPRKHTTAADYLAARDEAYSRAGEAEAALLASLNLDATDAQFAEFAAAIEYTENPPEIVRHAKRIFAASEGK